MTNGYSLPPKRNKFDRHQARIEPICFKNRIDFVDRVDRHLLVIVISGRYRLEKPELTTFVESSHIAALTLKAHQWLILEGEVKDKCEGLVCCMDFNFVKDFYDQYEDVFDVIANDTTYETSTSDMLVPISPLLEAQIQPLKYYVHNNIDAHQLVVEINVGAVIAAMALENTSYKGYLRYLCKVTLNDMTARLKSLLLEYIDSDVPINKIAAKGGYSGTAFNKLVREHLGLSPRQWINKARLEKSMALLKNKKNTVAYVCQEVGFESQSYFSVIFKKQFGVTPKKYQKSLNEKKMRSFEIV